MIFLPLSVHTIGQDNAVCGYNLDTMKICNIIASNEYLSVLHIGREIDIEVEVGDEWNYFRLLKVKAGQVKKPAYDIQKLLDYNSTNSISLLAEGDICLQKIDRVTGVEKNGNTVYLEAFLYGSNSLEKTIALDDAKWIAFWDATRYTDEIAKNIMAYINAKESKYFIVKKVRTTQQNILTSIGLILI